MKDGLPTLYWVFRWGWSALHFVVLAVIVMLVIVWALTDNHGANAFSAWYGWIDNMRWALSHLLPFPWGM